jgi:xylan 1,4-beta-xylosidase
MGRPLDPTEIQVEQLNRETALGQPERTALNHSRLELVLERNALAVLQITMKH